MYFPDKDKISESGRLSHSLILYDTLKYSLVSAEIAARSGKMSLAPNYSLGALYKELQSSNGFILALLLSIVQSTQTMNSLTVLLRLRGIQLFAESICSGTSIKEIPDPSVGGNIQDILEWAKTEDQYGIQFWRWSSDPVLAHDAFSSLMWIIYCLPCPFLSSEDAFLSLVQLSYVVAVTQAVIRVHGDGRQYFDSGLPDSSNNLKDAIRGMTFPFLRRCALFWSLIHSSRVLPFNTGTNISDGSTTSNEELSEIGKLEKLQKISPLDDIVNDTTIRLVVQSWLRHFYKQYGINVLYSTPAVSFRMMHLPHLYLDILQRYTKHNCPDCGAVQDDPALCLLCGKSCSPYWKACCRESASQTHAMACGVGIGVFLMIRSTGTLLHRYARGPEGWPSLYLDAFGEEEWNTKHLSHIACRSDATSFEPQDELWYH